MAIKTDTFSSAGGGAGTDNLDDVTSRGATTTNAITVGGVTVGTEYSLPTLDGSDGQVMVSNGAGTLSFTTLDFTGGLEYKGAFNATAGTPSLTNAEKGDFYIIDTAGTIYGQTWAVGDHLLINEDMGSTITNSKIDKIDNTQAVTSVNTQTGAVVISGNDVAADHTATNYTAGNANVDGHLSGIDTKLGTLLADITNESLNDLSDVSYTAGAGIDNYVLTYDNGTSSWGAEAVPGGSPASETVAGVIEIATNAEAGAGTATDKALVPSNISSLDLSTMDNTTSSFITVGDIPTASHSTAGILETATNAEATDASADDKIITPANLSHIDLSTFDNDEGFISNITNESLNDLSDVSFTAGAGIDNYVLTYDNGTSSWGAEVVPSAPVTSVNTLTGAVVVSGNDIAADHTATNYTAGNANVDGHLSGIDTKFGTLGTASTQDVGTSANNVVQLDGTAKLPAVDGSQLTNLPSAPVTSVNTLTGAVVVSGNDIAADHTATNYTATNSNVDGHLSGIDTKLGTLLADITGESLNDLSDVSFTAGAGIDNYVLTYDNGTSSWGAEAVPSAPVTSVNTQTGVVVISGNDVAADHTAVNYTAANANVDGHLSGIDTKLGTLGTAAFLDVGTSANNVVQLDGSSRLPAVDGSQLTNLPSGGGYTYSAITADPANAQANYHYSCTGTFTITLPTSGVSAGEEIRVKNMGTGTITIDPQTSNIDGSTTDYTLDVQYSAITLVSDGTGWEII